MDKKTSTLKTFPLSKVKANPYRNLDRYPLDQEKIDLLVESMKETGCWPNIVGRMVKDFVEIAYGHHRLLAAKKYLGSKGEIQVVVQDLSNEDMIKMMARENMEEWGASACVTLETVEAAVRAAARKEIKLREAKKGLRVAPSFLKSADRRILSTDVVTYNSQTLSEFLKWPDKKVGTAILALEFIELGWFKESHFKDISWEAATGMVRACVRRRNALEGQAKRREAIGKKFSANDKRRKRQFELARMCRVRAEEDVQTIGGEISFDLQEGNLRVNEIAIKASDLVRPIKKPVDIEDGVLQVCRALDKILSPKSKDKLPQKLKEIVDNRDALSQQSRSDLFVHFERLIERVRKFQGNFS